MLVDNALKPSTRKCYLSAFQHYLRFCTEYNKISMPASSESLMLYVSHMYSKGFKGSSIKVYFSAVRNYHIQSGLSSPLGDELLSYQRYHGPIWPSKSQTTHHLFNFKKLVKIQSVPIWSPDDACRIMPGIFRVYARRGILCPRQHWLWFFLTLDNIGCGVHR